MGPQIGSLQKKKGQTCEAFIFEQKLVSIFKVLFNKTDLRGRQLEKINNKNINQSLV
jgi:hypothetical protein